MSITFDQAKRFPSLWVDYVNSLNLEKLIGLYHPKADLIPTFQPSNITDPKGIEKYFNQLATRECLSVELYEETLVVQETTESVFIISGIYSFKFKVDGTLLTFPSRFTFVVNFNEDQPLLHHHSSQVPRTISN
jgi:hypothetical protein